MALKANGSTLSWESYVFAVRKDGETIQYDSLEDAQTAADAEGGKVVYAATYRTGWMETL